jgi:hypothetical protein
MLRSCEYTPHPPLNRVTNAPTTSTVKAVIGLGNIVRCCGTREEDARGRSAGGAGGEITITVDGGYTQTSAEVDTRDGPSTNVPDWNSASPSILAARIAALGCRAAPRRRR